MAVTLPFNPGPRHICVSDLEGHQLYRQDFNETAAADQFLSLNGQNYGWSLLGASLIPVRTDTWRNLAKDFFLPTFINHVLTVDSLALKLLQAVPAILWDLATLVFRLITVLPRAIYNHYHHAEHPLLQLLPNVPENRMVVITDVKANLETRELEEGAQEITLRIVQKPKTISLVEILSLYDPVQHHRTLSVNYRRPGPGAEWVFRSENFESHTTGS